MIYDAIWQPGSTELQRYEDEILLSKNEEWDYEKEERDLFKLSQLKTEPLDDGTRGFFLPIPASAIVSVSLGFKASTELKTKVQSMLQAHGILSTVKVEQAKLHDSDFALKFE